MGRRAARETALQMLFQMDVGQNDWQMTELTLAEAGLSDVNADFALSLVKGAWDNLTEIDRLIETYAKEWNIKRLANVDKNILRLAVYELKFINEVPYNVVINEAIELAKNFSTEDSGAFVNGVLDTILNQEVKKVQAKPEDGQAPAQKNAQAESGLTTE